MEEGGKEKGRKEVQRRSEGRGREEIRVRGREVREMEEGGKEKGRKEVQRRSEGRGREEIRERGREKGMQRRSEGWGREGRKRQRGKEVREM